MTPQQLAEVFEELETPPLAIGANCGVGAADLLAAIQQMTDSHLVIIAKSNCGIPEFRGTEIEYSGDPALMGRYAGVAIDSGATIIGGCCGTSPEHLVRMREALDTHRAGPAPTLEMIVNALGELVNTVATDDAEPSGRGRRSRRRPG